VLSLNHWSLRLSAVSKRTESSALNLAVYTCDTFHHHLLRVPRVDRVGRNLPKFEVISPLVVTSHSQRGDFVVSAAPRKFKLIPRLYQLPTR